VSFEPQPVESERLNVRHGWDVDTDVRIAIFAIPGVTQAWVSVVDREHRVVLHYECDDWSAAEVRAEAELAMQRSCPLTVTWSVARASPQPASQQRAARTSRFLRERTRNTTQGRTP
jgi:hypothetical protein